MKNLLKPLAILSALFGAGGTWVILSAGARVILDGGVRRPDWLFYMVTGGVLLVTSSLAVGGAWLFHRLGGALCSRNNAAALGGIGVYLLTTRAFPEKLLAAKLSEYESFKGAEASHAVGVSGLVEFFVCLSLALIAYKSLRLLINKCLGQTPPRADEGK
jgi:uncharacterized membrane protein